MKKKIIAIMLCCVLCINMLPFTASADDSIVTEDLSLQTTDIEDLYCTPDGTYLMAAGEQYIVMERIDVPLSSENAIKSLLEDPEIPTDTKNFILEKYSALCEQGMQDEVLLTVYNDKGIATNEGENSLYGVEEPTYYLLNGHEMKSIITSWTGIAQPTVQVYSGEKSYEAAQFLCELLLTLVGTLADSLPQVQFTLAIINGAMTLWDAYQVLTPIEKTTGASEDFIELSFTYDFYQRDVYVYSTSLESWRYALQAQQVFIREPVLRCCFWNDDGYSCNTQTIPITKYSHRINSPSFNDPWETAYNHMFLATYEDLEATVGDYRFVFGDFRFG